MCLCNLLLNGFIHSFQIGLIHEPVSNVYINDTQPCFLSKTAQQTLAVLQNTQRIITSVSREKMNKLDERLASLPRHFLSFPIVRNAGTYNDSSFRGLHFLLVPTLRQPAAAIIHCCWMWMLMKIGGSQRFRFELRVPLHSKQGGRRG